MGDAATAELFIAQWRETGGSELANTQSFINGLCALIGVPAPDGSRADDAFNDYVFERRVFQDNGDGILALHVHDNVVTIWREVGKSPDLYVDTAGIGSALASMLSSLYP